MPEVVNGAPANPVAVGGTPSAAVIDPTNQGRIPGAQPNIDAAKPWLTGDPDLDKVISAKGWKSDKDALRSYTEIESKFGTISNEHKQLMQFYQMLYPHLEDFDAFLAAKNAKPGESADNKSKEQMDPRLAEFMKETQGKLQANDEANMATARAWASDRFEKDFPEAEQYQKEIDAKFKSGDVVINNAKDPTDLYRALKNALNLVKQDVADKAEKARKAASVEGGSGNGPSGPTLTGMSLDQKRQMLQTQNLGS